MFYVLYRDRGSAMHLEEKLRAEVENLWKNLKRPLATGGGAAPPRTLTYLHYDSFLVFLSNMRKTDMF